MAENNNLSSSTEALTSPPENIQPSNLQSTTIEHLPPKPLSESEQEEAKPVDEVEEKVVKNPSNGIQPSKKRKEYTEEETKQRELHPMWKTSLCSYFRSSNGKCSHGDICRYAHGEEELRPRPGNVWDPTSERAKKILKVEKEKNEEGREDMMMTDALADTSADSALQKCLIHLPANWGSDKLKDYLNEQGVLYKSANKKRGMAVGFVSFENADLVTKAIEGLEGKFLTHKPIKVEGVVARSIENKIQSAESLDGPGNGETTEKNDPNVDSLVSKVRCARDAVTPLANMPYSSQLERKKMSLLQALKRLARSARKACPDGVPIPDWIAKCREIGGLPCKLEGILESPIVNGYRNKCEFSVGYSLQGTPTVGFMLGNFRAGVTAVEEPMDCPNVSIVACKFASIFQEFLQKSSLPIWNRLDNTGFWRQLTVREGRNPDQTVGAENSEAKISEVLLMVQVCSLGVDDELIKSEYQRMAHAFAQGATASSPRLPLTSLVVQDHKGISNAAPADAPLHSLSIPKEESASGQEEAVTEAGETRIHDYISNLRFSISPTAFFQVNTLAAEKLYSLAGDWADLGPDTLLFDVCCGTGTIGLTLAHRVGMVVGIEMNASAVSDAHKNAEANGIKNCKFVCGKAEDVMGSLLNEYLSLPNEQEQIPNASENNDNGNNVSDDKQNFDSSIHADADVKDAGELKEPNQGCLPEQKNGTNGFPGMQYKNVVAIVDPPRAGLHHVVIKALRSHPRLRRLVYISCNPDSLVANAIELCTPTNNKIGKGYKDKDKAWRNQTAASLARRRAKSMPNSEPFRPVKAMGVDLFPHTVHCEMVMLLER